MLCRHDAFTARAYVPPNALRFRTMERRKRDRLFVGNRMYRAINRCDYSTTYSPNRTGDLASFCSLSYHHIFYYTVRVRGVCAKRSQDLIRVFLLLDAYCWAVILAHS